MENREQFTYDGAVGMDGHLYDFHLIFRAEYLTLDMFPEAFQRKVKHGMVSPARKGCQTGPTFVNRLKNLELQARARGIDGDLMFCTDGHMSRFYWGVFKWLQASMETPACTLGHELYITPPSATGTCCILDQFFNLLHGGYADGAMKLRRCHGALMPIGRYEAASIMSGIHDTWADEKSIRWAWRKCGFKMADGIEAATVSIDHCPADAFTVADTIRELEVELALPAPSTPTSSSGDLQASLPPQ